MLDDSAKLQRTEQTKGAFQSNEARQAYSPPSLILHYPGNHCYLNSLVQALCWIYYAVALDRNSVFGDFHPLLRPLLSARGRIQLYRRSAWKSILQGWANVRQQQDPAELLEYLRNRVHVPGLRGRWKARTMRGEQVHAHQRMTGAPLIAVPCGRGLGLQWALQLWAYEQDSGHTQALTDPSRILTIQMLRFHANQSGEVCFSPSSGQNLRSQIHIRHRDRTDGLRSAFSCLSPREHSPLRSLQGAWSVGGLCCVGHHTRSHRESMCTNRSRGPGPVHH